MKENEFIFKHFPPISSKQWKQKIQYELQGGNYQTELINTNSDGISSLPYYTQSGNKQIVTRKQNVATKKAVHISVTDAFLANNKAIDAIEKGIDCIYFIIYDKEINSEILLANIKVNVVISTHFLSVDFVKSSNTYYKGNSLKLLTDPIGKLALTGNWYRNAVSDFEKLQQIINLNNESLTINASLFHNAGASEAQQIAYSIAQVISYSKHVTLSGCKVINYKVSVSANSFIEVAKLNALRLLHDSLNEHLNIKSICAIILLKSKRNLQAINTGLNASFGHTEQSIGFAGNANIVTGIPMHAFFFKEETSNWSIQLDHFIKTDYDLYKSLFEENIYIEKLTQQLLSKASLLIDDIEMGGGFLAQFKNGTLHRKITKKAIVEQKKYKQNLSRLINDCLLTNKTPVSYPFFKHSDKKTHYKPILEKRLAAPLEKPLWDTIYKHD